MPGDRRRSLRNVLSPRHRRWTYAASFAVALTGVLWLLAHYLLARDCEFGECRSPLEPWILRLHGAAALFALVQFGTLLPAHVARGWRARQNRPSGATVVAVVTVLLASGYGLYYVAAESWRPAISALHWIVGIGAIPVFFTHLYAARRAAARMITNLGRTARSAPARAIESGGGHKRYGRHRLR